MWRTRRHGGVVCITFHVCSSNAVQIVGQFAEIKLAEACCSTQEVFPIHFSAAAADVFVVVHIAVVVKIVAAVQRKVSPCR